MAAALMLLLLAAPASANPSTAPSPGLPLLMLSVLAWTAFFIMWSGARKIALLRWKPRPTAEPIIIVGVGTLCLTELLTSFPNFYPHRA